LAGSAAIGTVVAGTGIAEAREPEPSCELSSLIEKHLAAYEAFMAAIPKPNGGGNDHAEASRKEERALLDVCGFPATTTADRKAKAAYLLRRGELDLREHMQAILLSML
jgi:hypothetical protein